MTWVQKERWRYWNGDRVVELRHLFIEYRPTETHKHFILPYEILGDHSIAAMRSDLREWDWIAERSRSVDVPNRDAILEQIRQAVLVGGVALAIVDKRPIVHSSDPLSSLQALSDYMFRISNLLRDSQQDDLADEVFYSAMGYTWPTTECLLDKCGALRKLEELKPAALSGEALQKLSDVIKGVALWLGR